MVGGQVLDMEYTGRSDITLQGLRAMHAMKTGALIRASCECGAILGGGSSREQGQMRRFGEHLGLAFQVVDDVLDVVGNEHQLGKPVGSDQEAHKNTYPRHLGLEASMDLAREQVQQACDALDLFHGPHKDFLTGLAQYVLARACWIFSNHKESRYRYEDHATAHAHPVPRTRFHLLPHGYPEPGT
jgi:geranylgeranyl diphosphate synthase type II